MVQLVIHSLWFRTCNRSFMSSFTHYSPDTRHSPTFLIESTDFDRSTFSISSGASTRSSSPLGSLYRELIARTAFRRTYECRCSRQARMEGMRGSRISSSRMRHRKRRVTPLMYSLGCWRLFRRFWQIRICANQDSQVSIGSGVLQVVTEVLPNWDLRNPGGISSISGNLLHRQSLLSRRIYSTEMRGSPGSKVVRTRSLELE